MLYIHQLKCIGLFILFSFMGLAVASDDGDAGFYWYNSASTFLMASTAHEAAMLSCSQTCVDMVFQSTGSYTDGVVFERFKPLLENGSTGYVAVQVNRGVCDISTSNVASCKEGYGQPATCSDGFPPNIYGYEDFCDRPTPKLCPDGTYVEATSYCPVNDSVCFDYDSCYEYALSQANCSQSPSVFAFNYRDPTRFDFACETIDPSSPDHPDNGGNADGNEYNDPQSPEPPISTGESDPSALAQSIGVELRSDFGIIERAIRDSTSSANQNTNDTIEAINSSSDKINSSLSNIENAIREGEPDSNSTLIIDSVESASSSISDKIGSLSGEFSSSIGLLGDTITQGTSLLSSQLENISDQLESTTSCDPNIDEDSCQDDHGLSANFVNNISEVLNSIFDNTNEESLDLIKDEVLSLEETTPLSEDLLSGIFDPITRILSNSSECNPIIIKIPNVGINFYISCEFSDRFKSIFGFLLAFYTIQSIISIAISTPNKQKES